MQIQKKKQDEPKASSRTIPKVTIHARQMNEQEEQRLSTAVDAVLTEWVRQYMGRAQKP